MFSCFLGVFFVGFLHLFSCFGAFPGHGHEDRRGTTHEGGGTGLFFGFDFLGESSSKKKYCLNVFFFFLIIC